MSDTHRAAPAPLISDKLYNLLKFLALIAFPALGSFYFAIADLWGLPYAQQVVGSIVAFDTFLGILLGLSSRAYNASGAKYDGIMEVHEPDQEGVQNARIVFDRPEELAAKPEIALKVVPREAPAVPGDLPPVPPVG